MHTIPRWRPKSEIEWHRRHMGLANDLIYQTSMHSPSSNTVTNLVQCENIAKCSLMKLQQAIAVLNVMILHKHTRSFTRCTLQNLTDKLHR